MLMNIVCAISRVYRLLFRTSIQAENRCAPGHYCGNDCCVLFFVVSGYVGQRSKMFYVCVCVCVWVVAVFSGPIIDLSNFR